MKYIEIEVESKDYDVSLSTNLSATRKYLQIIHSVWIFMLYITINVGRQLL